MTNRLLARARTLGRAAERRLFHGDSAAVEPVDLWELVSPLRYDIVVRAEYFSFFAARRELFRHDFEEYVRQASRQSYFTWFSEVASTWHRGYDRTDPDSLMSAFRTRLRRSADLYLRFEEERFNPRFPISLRVAVERPQTRTGKVVDRSLFAGDGCHRLALLLASGERVLPPEWYRIRKDPLLRLIDNTHTLVGALRLSPEAYFEFLSRGYADELFGDKRSLLEHVAAHNPARLAELERVIAVDERQLDATTGDMEQDGRRYA